MLNEYEEVNNVEKVTEKLKKYQLNGIVKIVDELDNIKDNAEVMKALAWSLFEEIKDMTDEEEVLIDLMKKRTDTIIRSIEKIVKE